MTATGLPIQPTTAPTPVPTQAPAVDSALASTPSATQAPTDFMLALAQLLGTSVPQAPVSTTIQQALNASESTTDEASAAEADAAVAAAASLLPIAWTPPVAVPSQPSALETDPIEFLGLKQPTGVSARDAALLQALTERLAATADSTEPVDAAPETPTTVLAPNTTQVAQASQPSAQHEVASRALQSPVGTRAWAEELGSRLTLMTEKGQHTASLRLSPEHLGPLEVRISMRDDQASVWFGAAHADTRAAIEHALPRLREMFAAQGMSLADAGVFREPPRQQVPSQSSAAFNGSSAESSSESSATNVSVKVGLLDAYA